VRLDRFASTLALALVAVLAIIIASPAILAAEESVDQVAWEIARELRCPVCQNLSVADSSSELAGQMREIIRVKVAAGEPRDEILAYFVERYGEEVLAAPPAVGFAGLAWWGAAAIPLVGLAFAAIYLRQRLAVGSTSLSETYPDESEGERG
jgi:cytochrome c-type biogenesis protein CcmH